MHGSVMCPALGCRDEAEHGEAHVPVVEPGEVRLFTRGLFHGDD